LQHGLRLGAGFLPARNKDCHDCSSKKFNDCLFAYFHCRDNSKKKDVRIMNIEAAKAVADAVRTSLGPRGMDKMVSQASRRQRSSTVAHSSVFSFYSLFVSIHTLLKEPHHL
jgi:hypothetical protein